MGRGGRWKGKGGPNSIPTSSPAAPTTLSNHISLQSSRYPFINNIIGRPKPKLPSGIEGGRGGGVGIA